MATDNQSLSPSNLGGLKVRKASESKENPTTLIYGDGGTGKTTLAASSADVDSMCPVLHLNIENGADSIRKRTNIDVVDIESIAELQSVFSELYQKQGAGYKTVIVDNLTEAQAIGIDHILKTPRLTYDFVEFEGATWQNGAYNRSSEQMRKLMRYFRDLPVHTIFIAWEKNYANEGPAEIGPAFTKTFGQEAPGLVNDVYRLSVKGGERVLQTGRTDRLSAKDRTGTLPTIIRNPTMSLLNDYWTGKLVKPDPSSEPEKKSSTLATKKR